MCVWGNTICTSRRYNKTKQFDLSEPHRQYNFHNNHWHLDEAHLYDRQIRSTHQTQQCMATSMTTTIPIRRTKPTKSYHIRSIDCTFRWHYIWHAIFVIWSLNLIAVAIANDSIGILTTASLPTSQQQQQQQQQHQQQHQQPCNRSRRVFTDVQGEISDGPTGSNYTQDSHCEWLVKAKNDSQFITLKFHTLATECSYDYVFVYDGDSLKSPLLGSFSGKTMPQQVMATSGSMLILLYSDTNYVLNGFRAEYFISNCPNNCSNRGKCVGHQCVCKGDWIAKDCSIHACPDNCGAAEGRGICSKEHCRCKNGYSGKACSLHIEQNVENEWHYLASGYSGLTPRAAHSAIYVRETDSLYVYGGFDLNKVLGALQIYRFNKSTWEDELGISLRSRHFPAEWDNTLLKAILHQNEEEARLWGLKSDASFFRTILLSISDENFLKRRHRKRSAALSLTLNESISNQDFSEFLEELSEKSHVGPMHRYGHAACNVPIEGGGFVIHGGKLENGSLSNDLWMFNASADNPQSYWTLRAINSTIQPPNLTRHTITLADDYLYVFGGSLSTGDFSSRIFRIKLMQRPDEDQWEEIFVRGGKAHDVRVVGHTTIYDQSSNSLIVYGGVVVNVARFSKLSDRMFAFHLSELHWTEILYPRMQLRDAHIPRERAFHTAVAVGNYMIVFGGYTHRHNKEEICYDNQMYLYHLRCHTWVNTDVMGMNSRKPYPKKQGIFAHAAAVRNDNTLLLVGGYHGNVNADLLAYTLPPMLQIKRNSGVFDPEAYCHKHTAISECLSDLDCGWCSTDNICYGRTVGANCTANLQTTWCPGVCPALGNCHACLIHGKDDNPSADVNVRSFADKFGLNHCQWCVQNARCQHKSDNYGTCGSGDDTPSQEIGWWGVNGVVIDSAMQCSRLDRRPGLTFIKYYSPINWNLPDEVNIVNATMIDFLAPLPSTKTESDIHGDIIARLYGFIRPPKKWAKDGETWQMCASYSEAILRMNDASSESQDMQTMGNLTSARSTCQAINWTNVLDKDVPANDTILSERLLIDIQANRSLYLIESLHQNFYHAPSRIGLQHSGLHDNSAFTFEYLEPYSRGNCDQLTNCMECLADSACGWCDATQQCMPRTEDEQLNCFKVTDNQTLADWKYFVVEPSQCINCSDYITCNQCTDSGICEWWSEDARCFRLGRSPTAIIDSGECPMPCHTRENCTSCLDDNGRCVWCETTSTCFSFSVYTSEFQFGICREWLDQPLADDKDVPRQQCKSCESHRNCSTCLQSLNCGWCFDRDNPIEGVCMQGDFNSSITQKCDNEWAYAQCPDVDECGLGLHDCHKEAKCTNTLGSYDCYCRRGFVGDGRTSCERTCYEQCVNGICSGAPDYKCICDLGWTGESCSVSCGCNNHSTCRNGPGICDNCQHWTEGDACERCRSGSYGNATSIDDMCRPCDCNGHGNEAHGTCDIQTGECFCQENTEGVNCEKCSENYYGNPKDGGQCYFQCESRGMLKQTGLQGIGSYQSHKNPFGPEVRECLWIISPHSLSGAQLMNNIIELEIKTDPSFNVTCNENAVYVYDGLPDLIGHTQQRQLLSVFCTEDTKYYMIQASSGHLTVHYKQSVRGQGFNAVYRVRSCETGTCIHPRRCEADGRCVCNDGFAGVDCSIEKCPRNCSEALNQGVCDKMYGRCLCNKDFGGRDCSVPLKYEKSVIATELFNSELISDSLDHLRKTLPRFGHSLLSDKRGNLWMFAGYSLHHQALNDIRQFDTRNSSWMQITIDSTPEAKMPQGRYFHGADIQHSKQMIYVYGGMTGMSRNIGTEIILDDFWKFSVVNQRWREVDVRSKFRPPQLAGHSLTLIKDGEHDVLLLIGGFSPSNGLSHLTYAFNLTTSQWSILNAVGSAPSGIYGHSAVYHSFSQSVYVFGGYVFQDNDRTKMSSKLYALNMLHRQWSEIPNLSGINRIEENLPRARFLHSAITTDNYMLIFGGRTQPQNSSDLLLAYVYKCNLWIRLTENIDMVESLKSSYAQGMAYDSDAIYIVSGWDGSINNRVTRLNLPNDLCELFGSSKNLCRHFMGCTYCVEKPYSDPTPYCYSNERTDVCTGNDKQYNKGIQCDVNAIAHGRNCASFLTCEACTAVWLYYSETQSPCRWCSDSTLSGRCIPVNSTQYCDAQNTLVTTNDQCPSSRCNGDCEVCNKRGCHWNQNDDHSFCTNEEKQEMNTQFEMRPQSRICPNRCATFKNCSSCLSASELSDGGYSDCRWSTQLQQCISPSYQPLWCVGGVCGLVLQPEEISFCPEPCSAYTKCFDCLRHAHCGWCSKNDTEGEGVCTEGSLESPSEFPAASTCDIIYYNQKNLTTIDPTDAFVWNYVKCPPENECINNHHNCDAKSERCIDRLIGYECECADGFEAVSLTKDKNIISDNSTAEFEKVCIPKCTQGCVRGRCTEPNKCECDFGYVGANCSIVCQCNGHSNCQGPDQLDVCLECHNNTIGSQCEQCKPLFVGDPVNNGECVSCFDYCHGHTDLCVERSANMTVKTMNRDELLETLTRGPIDDAICLGCKNRTTEDRCEGCMVGHFRGSEEFRLPCRKCHCQGHGDTCDPITGEKCNCGNNTESDTTCTSNRNSAHQCWMLQCSKCRDSYTGNPIDGHQCYKQITVESKMCFDAKTIDECKKPAPLKNGHTTFFVIQPRFMNVDIRIIVDVTQGELNLYMSPQDDALVVETHSQTSHHNIQFDRKYAWFADYNSELFEPITIASPGNIFNETITFTENKHYRGDITHDCTPMKLNSLFVKDVQATELSTYVTLNKCNTMLRVYNLKNRLVLTLPQHIHNLSTTRFYIALKAVNGPASYGLVFFRQDQLHIDLFVFFSVFFSCFFLFLAVCVVVWKAKQAADMRRARLRHVVEMLHLARRPFASIQLSVSSTGTPPHSRRRILRGTNSKQLSTNIYQNIRPIAVEPTADNSAAVCTVFVRLPDTGKSSPTIALASSLVSMNTRQFPAYQRIPYIRRRRISNGLPNSPNQNVAAGPSSPPVNMQRPPASIQLRMHRERNGL